jgi:hypothetical protein
MRIATYNILKGGSQRVHWVKTIEGHSVDLLLVQESYAPDEHLPPQKPVRMGEGRGEPDIALSNLEGTIHAIDDACLHTAASLGSAERHKRDYTNIGSRAYPKVGTVRVSAGLHSLEVMGLSRQSLLGVLIHGSRR